MYGRVNVMSYLLPNSVRELQEKVRQFVDEVGIPRELEAEMNPEVAQQYKYRNMEWAKDNGLWAMTMPSELGGGGLGFLEQAIVNEQSGRATNGVTAAVPSLP